MSTQVQVLVTARDVADVLGKIGRREKFRAYFNPGTWVEKQFTRLMLDLSEWEFSNIQIEPYTRTGNIGTGNTTMAQVDNCYECDVIPRPNVNHAPPERRLEPNL